MIEHAFHAYITAVETIFEAGRHPPPPRKGLVILQNKADRLRSLVEHLEEGREFKTLLEETRAAFCRDWNSSKNGSDWRHAIGHFFRRTGYYTDTFVGADAPSASDLFETYKAAFLRRHVQTTYLAPVEYVNFLKPKLKFSEFDIRRFDRNELDTIVNNDVNRVFYPYAVVDTQALQEYWFIVAKTQNEAPRLGWFNIDLRSIDHVSPGYTHFPRAIKHILARMILFDWVEESQDGDMPYGLHFGFNVPFVVRVDENDLTGPRSAPDCSTLETDPQTTPTGDDYEIRSVIFFLNESRVVAFEKCIERADDCLRRLESYGTQWPFLEVAVDYLIKAFFAHGLEQLLWHITTLETLLGERNDITQSLARRTAALLGTTEKERKELRKQFKELYNLRSNLVHGSEFKKDVEGRRLFEAREMARRVMIRIVHGFGEIAARVNEGSWQGAVPKREDFLRLLDLSNAGRDRLSALLSNLPAGFPTGRN